MNEQRPDFLRLLVGGLAALTLLPLALSQIDAGGAVLAISVVVGLGALGQLGMAAQRLARWRAARRAERTRFTPEWHAREARRRRA